MQRSGHRNSASAHPVGVVRWRVAAVRRGPGHGLVTAWTVREWNVVVGADVSRG